MFQEITYALIFGIPFIVYLGLLTIVCFFITGMIASLKRRGKLKNIPIKWHYNLAYLSITLAIIHGFFGLVAYL